MSQFGDYINEVDFTNIEDLPLNHITSISFIDLFLEGNRIPADYQGACEIFNKYLIYFFYGKPAFKMSEDNALPICLAIRKGVTDAYKIFPFDSGAFYYKRMSSCIVKNTNLQDFEIFKDHKSIKKVITNFFGNNSNYYENVADSKHAEEILPDIVREYICVICKEPDEYLDDRKNTIEVIFDNNLNLDGIVEFIIIPKIDYNFKGEIIQFKDFASLIEDKFKCDVFEYDITDTFNYYNSIRSIFKKNTIWKTSNS